MRDRQNGFTIIELVVVLSMFSIILGMAIVNLSELVNPVENGAASIMAFMKEARARALSTTSAYTVYPTSTRRVITEYGDTCSDASPVADGSLVIDLPSNVFLSDTTWSVCFDSRGFPDANVTVPVVDIYEGTRTVEIFLGGAVRVQ